MPDVVREMELKMSITGSLTIFKGHFKCHNEFCLKSLFECILFSFSTNGKNHNLYCREQQCTRLLYQYFKTIAV